MIVCGKCSEERPRDQINKNGWCKGCKSAAGRAWYQKNRAAVIEKVMARDRSRPEERKAYNREYYQQNKDTKFKEYAARKDPAKKRACEQSWRERHRERYREYMRRGAFKRRARVAEVRNDLTFEQWQMIKAAYRFCCAYCGKRRPLTQDHIIPVSKGGEHTAENIVPACQSCNARKWANPPQVAYQPHLLSG